MKIKVAEATNIQLNWLVATIEGKKVWICLPNSPQHVIRAEGIQYSYSPATDPAQAWPIIDREKIDICHHHVIGKVSAIIWFPEKFVAEGINILTAAMRCYVGSRLGDKVEVPKELA